MIPHAHHIAIEVTNTQRSRDFYQSVFGLNEIPRLTESRSGNGGAWFRLGNLDLHLQERSKGCEKSGQHFALVVGNLEETANRATKLGGKVEEAKLLDGFSKRCFLRDPDDNRIEILQK